MSRTIGNNRTTLYIAAAVAVAALAVALSTWPVQAQSGVPVAPARPAATSVSHESVTLTWADPGDSTITGYQILRRNRDTDDVGDFTVIEDDTGSSATSYTDTTVEASSRYVYRVKARNSHGLSPQSGFRNVDTSAPPVPAAPARPIASSVTHNSVTLSWSDPNDSSITGYQILRRNRDTDDIGDFTVIEDDTGSSATGYTDTTVEASSRYVYRVKGRNSHGLSEESGFRNVKTPAAPANSPATGAPAITGTAQVGQTLTAGTSGISDADGLTSVQYSYQWVRTSSGTDADIAGETAATYTLVAADEGNTVKVRVSFTDDHGYAETLTSAATAQVTRPANQAATGAPAIAGNAVVGETLTADTSGISDSNGLTNVSYAYQWIRSLSGTDTNISGATASTYTLVEEDIGYAFKLQVSFTDDASNAESLTSAATALVRRANQVPTGLPTITGTVKVGETLTADTSGISDGDGLTNVTYSYQWIRSLDGTDSDISWGHWRHLHPHR